MHAVVTVAAMGFLLASGRLQAQELLREEAQVVLGAWTTHDAAGILAGADSILLNLPGAQPAAPIGRQQATALIRGYLGGTSEEALTLQAVRSTGRDRGFAELARRFRPAEGSASRTETILLGFRLEGEQWRLDELRVVR
jgi:hypothetical protein